MLGAKMRVIRTEMYFDEIPGYQPPRSYRRRGIEKEDKNPGIAFAWFRSEEPGPFDIGADKTFRVREITPDHIPGVLGMLLRNSSEIDEGNLDYVKLDKDYLDLFEEARPFVDYIYNEPIILEQSPPTAIPFKDILKRTNAPIYLGSYLGYGLSYDQPVLLIITIPMGIVVVGSAIGVADAMAAGLNKRIAAMFDRQKGSKSRPRKKSDVD